MVGGFHTQLQAWVNKKVSVMMAKEGGIIEIRGTLRAVNAAHLNIIIEDKSGELTLLMGSYIVSIHMKGVD